MSKRNLIPPTAAVPPALAGHHPAPRLHALSTLANLLFLAALAATHRDGRLGPAGSLPGWLAVPLFPLLAVGFPQILRALARQGEVNRAMRVAWAGLEDIVFEHVSAMVEWHRRHVLKNGAAPARGEFDALLGGFLEDLRGALDDLPVLVRMEMRRDLGRLAPGLVLWGRLRELPGAGPPLLEERVHRELHRAYVLGLRPEKVGWLVAAGTANLVAWWWIW